eukprot:407379_1
MKTCNSVSMKWHEYYTVYMNNHTFLNHTICIISISGRNIHIYRSTACARACVQIKQVHVNKLTQIVLKVNYCVYSVMHYVIFPLESKVTNVIIVRVCVSFKSTCSKPTLIPGINMNTDTRIYESIAITESGQISPRGQVILSSQNGRMVNSLNTASKFSLCEVLVLRFVRHIQYCILKIIRVILRIDAVVLWALDIVQTPQQWRIYIVKQFDNANGSHGIVYIDLVCK